ncbi:hypothetical protein CFK37_00465 [Virgibacillus phasianinus]|uniref:Uncharacterized protein n=1 Tax=Virgibacillus phasianinus TaxID=2017483 RepID=A0A220TYF3_9BACI|nr:hypothetical protein [Virgibacillus phasianinus]ASK60785.1 hypothetical protein CFK37_00465 [Virgibacillus phasianinus]
MSENKKVYHVKDLIIKADNVYVERDDHHRRNPFFGGKHDHNEAENEYDHHDHEEKKHDRDEEDEEKDKRRHRRPFWF